MNLYVDIPLLTYFPYILAGVVAAIVGGLIWVFYAKPRMDQALPKEEYCGILKIHLPQLGIFNIGPLNTAYNTMQEIYGKLITNSDGEEKKEFIAVRDDLEKCHLFAQRTEDGEKYFYVCDENLLDPKFHGREDKPSRLGQTTPIRNVGQVQECVSKGELDGFTWVGIVLGAGMQPLPDTARQNLEVRVEAVKHARLAANSKETIKFLKNRVDTAEDALKTEMDKHAETRSKLDRALSGLNQKVFSVSPDTKVPGAFGLKLKQWFSWPQILCAGIGYFASPSIIGQFWPGTTPPNTAYITALITVGAFFIIPAFRKVFGRWL